MIMSKLIYKEGSEQLIGQKFGKLTVISPVYRKIYSKRNRAFVDTKCDCGNEKVISCYISSLVTGHTSSCGCFQVEMAIKALKKLPDGTYFGPEYQSWHDMKQRCQNPNIDNKYESE